MINSIFFIITGAQSNQCTYGDVHLVGGSGDHEGNVQVCINGTWGYVCDNSWNYNDARVVCRQLGYSTSSYNGRAIAFYIMWIFLFNPSLYCRCN